MRYLHFTSVFLITTLLLSCSKDDSIDDSIPAITLADLAGSWIATSSTFTNNANDSEKVDFIAKGGEIRFTMFTDGRVRTWIEFNGSPVDEWDALAVIKEENVMVVTPAEMSRSVYTLGFKLEDDQVTLTNENDRFDFTLMGGEEVSATSVITFVPN